PFSDADIALFTKKWCQAVYPHDSVREQALVTKLGTEISRPQVRQLARNPMMLTALAVIHFAEGKQLPEQRSELYRRVLEWLAMAREAKTGGDHKDFLSKMRMLALAASKRAGPREAFDLDEAVSVLADDFQEHRGKEREFARRFLEEERITSGVI